MYLPKRALISFASGMGQFFLVFICYISFYYSLRLHLPSEIVPATHKKAVRAPRPATIRPEGGDGAYRAPRGGDRDGYRSKKEEGAPGEYRPQFAGVGRGSPRE